MLRWAKSTHSPGILRSEAWDIWCSPPNRPPRLPRLEFQDICLVLLLVLFCHPTNLSFSRLLEVFLLPIPVFLKFFFRQFPSFWSFPSASSCLSEVFLLQMAHSPVFLKFSFCQFLSNFPSTNGPFSRLSEVFILLMAHSPVFLKFSFYQSLSEVFILSMAHSPVFLKFSFYQWPSLLEVLLRKVSVSK